VERLIVKPGAEDRAADANRGREVRAELGDDMRRDIEPVGLRSPPQQVCSRLAAPAHGVEHLATAQVDARDQRLIKEEAPVKEAPFIRVMRVVGLSDPVVMRPLPGLVYLGTLL